MRIEREDDGRATQRAGLLDQPRHDARMAEVHAVEVADRHGAAAKFGGQIRDLAQ